MFYSQLDEILFDDEQKRESQTWKGAWKRIQAATDHKQALGDELSSVWRHTPLKTKIVLWTVIAFVFVLVVPIF